MRGSRSTEGATLIVVVLFTMLLLAALLAASSQLTLSSRRTTADQAASLRAQYVAESRVALAQSRLRNVQEILSPSRSGANGTKIDHMVVPYTTTKDVLKLQAELFCNKVGSTSAWQPTSEFAGENSEGKSYPDAKECRFESGNNPAQFAVLAQYVQPAAFDILPVSERPSNVNDYATRLAWWTNLLTQQQQAGDARYNLRPLRVVQLTQVKYRFYIRLQDLRVQGQQDGATRVLAASRTANSQWWFEIELPSLLDDVLMTNHHRAKPTGTYSPTGAPGVNFDDQIFDGSIHTNEKFLFTSDSSAQFKGKVSSVGCTDLPQNGPASSGNCTATPGVHIGSTTPTAPPLTENTAEKRDAWIANQVAASPRTVQFVKDSSDPAKIDYKKTDFTAEYKPLPANENDQKAAAQNGGLVLNDATGVELMAGDSSGNALSNYVPGNPRSNEGAWQEPSPTYQYIRTLKYDWSSEWYTSDTPKTFFGYIYDYVPDDAYNSTPNAYKKVENSGGYVRYFRRKPVYPGTVIDEYRYGPDKKLYKKSSGGWNFVKNDFNGVIFGERFDGLRGPDRRGGNKDDGSLSNVPPALASFSGITIASTGNITIDSDLTVSDTPCSFAALTLNPPCTKKPANILGIYSQSGDVIFSKRTRRDLNIHASIIASTGQVTAEEFATRPNQGNVNLIGSLIENWYGAFGLVGTAGNGYGRDFTYDQRLKEGTVPPFFPVSPRWTVAAAAAMEPRTGLGNVVLRQATASEY